MTENFRKIIREWRLTILAGAFILLVALFLRLFNLTLLPVFADEAIYIRWAQVMGNEPTLRFLPLSDGKQPLFMWVLMFLVHRFQDPLFIGRLISVEAGIGTLVGIFGLTYYLFRSQVVSLVASFLYALSPFSLFFDRMALVDSLLTMFGVWTLFLGLMTAKTKRLDVAILTGFALGGAFLTKSPALFFVILLPTTWLLSELPRSAKKMIFHLLRLAGLILVTYAIAYGMFTILRLGPNFHLLASRNQDYVFPLSHLWENPKDPFIFYFDRSFEWLGMMGPFWVLLLVVVGILTVYKKHWREVLVLTTWFIFPIMVQSMFAKVFTARYILFVLPPLFILSGVIFLTKQKLILKIGYILFSVFILHALWFDSLLLTNPEAAPLPRSERSGYLEEWTAGTGIREVAEIVKALAINHYPSSIVIGTEGYFGTLPDGLQIYLEGIENVTVTGVGLNFGEVPEPLLDSVRSGTETYFVVNSSRLNFENFDDRGLKVIASYKKADRPHGLKEYNIHGPHDTLYLFEVTENAIKVLPADVRQELIGRLAFVD